MEKLAGMTAIGKIRDKALNQRIKRIAIQKTFSITWFLFRTFFLIGMAYVILYPMLSMLTKAFRTGIDILDPTVVWIPRNVTLEHFPIAWKNLKYVESVTNTLKVGVVSSILQLLSCCFIGYGFARFKFRGRGVLFALVLFTIIVPPQTVTIPQYLQYRYFNPLGFGSVNLLNTGWTFYLPSLFGVGLRSGLFIYIFRQFFKGMPNDLEDAAKMDGCGSFRTFARIMLPLAIPAFLTVFLFSFVWHWNDFVESSMYFQNKNKPLSLSLAKIALGRIEAEEGPGATADNNAAALLFVLPPLLVFLAAQRYFIEGVERTGIKG